MSNRDFSDSIKLEVIKANLEKNNGKICCEVCGTQLSSIKECHFDHIHPFAKGGKSTLENCQLLCADCNLKKNDKREVDDIISKWVKEGHDIPNSHELSKMGLPSRDVILRYYENWKEPFYIYKKLYEELGRH